jgi:hypothetical protein
MTEREAYESAVIHRANLAVAAGVIRPYEIEDSPKGLLVARDGAWWKQCTLETFDRWLARAIRRERRIRCD